MPVDQFSRNASGSQAGQQPRRFIYRPRPVPQWAVASSLIGHWTPAIQELLIILYCRVSRRSQRDHLRDQERRLRDAVGTSGTIIAVFTDVANGTDYDRPGLRAAISLARRTGAIILGEDRTRIIRGSFYTPRNQDDRLTEAELRHLEDTLDGVQAYTFLDPDASSSEARSSQTKRGVQKPTARKRVRLHRHDPNATFRSRKRYWKPSAVQARFIALLQRTGTPIVDTHTPHITQHGHHGPNGACSSSTRSR